MQNPASIFTVRPAVHVPSAEGGTRTHAPLRTNGFQDRLVMTTSIPLQTSWKRVREKGDFVNREEYNF